MIVIVMGVCGTGKTTVGELIAARLGARFEEGDRFHPSGNVEKMSRGQALDDEDRWPWLDSIARAIDEWQRAGDDVVLACSALKQRYRDIILGDRPDMRLVYLFGSRDLISKRMTQRRHHFMPASLVPSQFAALEPPAPGEHVLAADVTRSPEAIATDVLAWIGKARGHPISH